MILENKQRLLQLISLHLLVILLKKKLLAQLLPPDNRRKKIKVFHMSLKETRDTYADGQRNKVRCYEYQHHKHSPSTTLTPNVQKIWNQSRGSGLLVQDWVQSGTYRELRNWSASARVIDSGPSHDSGAESNWNDVRDGLCGRVFHQTHAAKLKRIGLLIRAI